MFFLHHPEYYLFTKFFNLLNNTPKYFLEIHYFHVFVGHTNLLYTLVQNLGKFIHKIFITLEMFERIYILNVIPSKYKVSRKQHTVTN